MVVIYYEFVFIRLHVLFLRNVVPFDLKNGGEGEDLRECHN